MAFVKSFIDYDGLEVIDLVETPSDLATYEENRKKSDQKFFAVSATSEVTQMGQRSVGGKMIPNPG